jgi:uncharacterized protein (DUF4213/DUF364 family)
MQHMKTKVVWARHPDMLEPALNKALKDIPEGDVVDVKLTTSWTWAQSGGSEKISVYVACILFKA